jgi:iron complex transport system ATP-binding protein
MAAMGLEVLAVDFAYTASRPVLREVSFALRPGTVTALVGPNGAGKSTLLRLMAGVRTPGAGRVTLDGVEIASIPRRSRAHRIAYLAQSPSVAFAYTVREFVRLGRYAAGSGGGDAAVARALARVDLSDRADDLFGALSAGQQQRAALARVLAQLDGAPGSPVLLADEPVAAMDPRHALAAMTIFNEMAAAGGGAVAVVLHDLNLAARFCSDALVLDSRGRVAASGPAERTLTPGVLDPVFNVAFQTFGDPADPRRRAILASPPPPAAGH